MQIATVNRRAQQRYGQFVSAMDLVLEALESLDGLIAEVDPKRAAGGWTVPTPEELSGHRQKATDELERLREIAKKYEAELISRDWRL